MTYSDKDFARYTFGYWRDHPEEQESIVQEHVARIEQGIAVWNAFDQAFADYLKANDIDDGFYGFYGAEFKEGVDLRGATFSGDTDFSKAKFRVLSQTFVKFK